MYRLSVHPCSKQDVNSILQCFEGLNCLTKVKTAKGLCELLYGPSWEVEGGSRWKKRFTVSDLCLELVAFLQKEDENKAKVQTYGTSSGEIQGCLCNKEISAQRAKTLG